MVAVVSSLHHLPPPPSARFYTRISVQSSRTQSSAQGRAGKKNPQLEPLELLLTSRTTNHQASILLFVLAVLLPPAAVLAARGCGAHFCLNILLTLLGWLPGLVHAWYVVARADRRERTRQHRDQYGMERRRAAYR